MFRIITLKNLLLTFVLTLAGNIFGQNVGIGTINPLRSLHLNNGTFLITGDTGTVPNLTTGAKFFFASGKSAFRAGLTTGSQWNYASLGQSSFAFGRNSNASGSYSMSGGEGSNVSNTHSFAVGLNITNSGQYAAGFGNANILSGNYGFATGNANNVTSTYGAAFGNNLQVNSFGSLVLGRYNEIAGSATTWVATDPIFVIGNGIFRVDGITRSNAFSVAKNGNMKVGGNAEIEGNSFVAGASNTTGNSFVNGISYALGGSVLSGTTTVTGNTNLNGNTYINNKVVVANDNIIEADKVAGTAPIINLIPIGVVHCDVVYDRNPTFDDCTTAFTNLAGNFISSATGLCDAGVLIADAKCGIKLFFNSAQVLPYKEIIAVPSLTFNGIGFSGNVDLAQTASFVQKNSTTNKPEFYEASYGASEIPEIGTFTVRGTVMFYGLK